MTFKDIAEMSKKEIIEKYAKDSKDTGSSEVQIAVLTHRIAKLTVHFQSFKKDHASKRGLLKIIGQRKRMLKYLENVDSDRATKLKKELGIRH
jgi:small subunit ribosomal protein S15